MEKLQQAKEQLNQAAEAIKEKYKLSELSKKQKDLAEALKKLHEKAYKSAPGDKDPSDNINRAQQKAQQAAKKLKESEGEQDSQKKGNKLGGAKKDNEEDKKELEEAMKKLKEQLELLKMIQALMQVEKSLGEMLKIQTEINDKTIKLGETKTTWEEQNAGREWDPAALNDRMSILVLKELVNKQSDLATLAEKMSQLLADEGKMVFPEVLNIVKDDMLTVVDMLKKNQVGEDTQSIQADIKNTLIKLLQSVSKDLQTLKEKQSQQQKPQKQKPQQQKPQKKPLLPTLAEIKLLRILQIEINVKTEELDKNSQERESEISKLQNISQEEKDRKIAMLNDMKLSLGKRLASKQAKIQNLVDTLIKKIAEAQKQQGQG